MKSKRTSPSQRVRSGRKGSALSATKSSNRQRSTSVSATPVNSYPSSTTIKTKQRSTLSHPLAIRISPKVTYEIFYLPVLYSERGEELAGECRYESKQILISLNQAKKNIAQTLIHEMIHAIDFEYPGAGIYHPQIEKLEWGLFQILILNGFIKL